MAEHNIPADAGQQDEPELRRTKDEPKGVLQKNLKPLMYLGVALLAVARRIFELGQQIESDVRGLVVGWIRAGNIGAERSQGSLRNRPRGDDGRESRALPSSIIRRPPRDWLGRSSFSSHNTDRHAPRTLLLKRPSRTFSWTVTEWCCG